MIRRAMIRNQVMLAACSFAFLLAVNSAAYWQSNSKAQTKAASQVEIHNELIDESAFLKSADQAIQLRKQRRLTEAEFIKLSQKPRVIVLDARSKDRYQQVHIKGAISLPFTDISFDSLAKALPDKNATILIYCNNNFRGNAPELQAKSPGAALNLSTFSSLYDYGYRNIYELGPALDIRTTKLTLVGDNAEALKQNR
ncbi:MAG: rhodanese-like domain-containing protein [Pirellulales bacterium]